MNERIEKALDYAIHYGGIDGDHHKAWVIDQMVRALTGCPMVIMFKSRSGGTSWECQVQGEFDEYKKLVADACDGIDGPATHTWDVGTAP